MWFYDLALTLIFVSFLFFDSVCLYQMPLCFVYTSAQCALIRGLCPLSIVYIFVSFPLLSLLRFSSSFAHIIVDSPFLAFSFQRYNTSKQIQETLHAASQGTFKISFFYSKPDLSSYFGILEYKSLSI